MKLPTTRIRILLLLAIASTFGLFAGVGSYTFFYAEGLSYYAMFLAFLGRVDEALRVNRKALALDPLAPLINMNGGWTYFSAGMLVEAAEHAAKMIEIEERLQKLRSPFRSAETFWIEEIIDPRDTRPLLCDWANLAAPLRTPGPSSHGMRP